MTREPGYCLHKATGQAYVNLGGKVVYLGKYRTDESREAYSRVKAEWLVYATTPASQFGPVLFRTIRDWWIKAPIEFKQVTNTVTRTLSTSVTLAISSMRC